MRLSRRRPSEHARTGQPAAPDGPSASPNGPAAARPASAAAAPEPTTMARLASSLADGVAEPHSAGLTAELEVEDELEPRIRIPSDLLRCITAGIEIALLIGLGLLAKQTTSGVDVDVIGASRHLAKGLVNPMHKLAFIALLVLPVALAVRLVMIGQLRRLAEASAIGLVAAGVTVACNVILKIASLSQLYHALASPTGPGGATLLD